MEMKNVLDQLKAIAENNDSEDVARAIQTVGRHQRDAVGSFKGRLAEAGVTVSETRDDYDYDAGEEGEYDGPDRDEDEQQFSDDDLAQADAMKETPGDDDDQYCANCGNTGFSLHTTGETCPNCGEGEGEQADKDSRESDDIGEDPHGIGDGGGAAEAWNRISDRVDNRDAGGNRPPDDTQASDGLGNDPWGIGEDDAGGASVPDDVQVSRGGNSPGGAVDRVRDRSNRSGSGGPVERVQLRASERNGDEYVDEDMGNMSFNTPMDRHQWLMQELSQAAGQMDPESAQVVKGIIQKAGNADVKGGNC